MTIPLPTSSNVTTVATDPNLPPNDDPKEMYSTSLDSSNTIDAIYEDAIIHFFVLMRLTHHQLLLLLVLLPKLLRASLPF